MSQFYVLPVTVARCHRRPRPSSWSSGTRSPCIVWCCLTTFHWHLWGATSRRGSRQMCRIVQCTGAGCHTSQEVGSKHFVWSASKRLCWISGVQRFCEGVSRIFGLKHLESMTLCSWPGIIIAILWDEAQPTWSSARRPQRRFRVELATSIIEGIWRFWRCKTLLISTSSLDSFLVLCSLQKRKWVEVSVLWKSGFQSFKRQPTCSSPGLKLQPEQPNCSIDNI